MKITKVYAIQIEDKPVDQPGWRPIVCVAFIQIQDYMEMGKLQLHMVLDLQRHME